MPIPQRFIFKLEDALHVRKEDPVEVVFVNDDLVIYIDSCEIREGYETYSIDNSISTTKS